MQPLPLDDELGFAFMVRWGRALPATAVALLAIGLVAVMSACTDTPVVMPRAGEAPRPYTTEAVYRSGASVEFRSRVGMAFATRCLDVQGGRRDIGAPLTLWTCLDVPQQTFRWDAASGAIRVYEAEGSVLCIDAGAAPQQYGPVYTYTCHGGAPQQWEPARADVGGQYHIRLRQYPNLCLDVPGGSQMVEGVALQLYPCLDPTEQAPFRPTQQWDAVIVASRGPAVGFQAVYGTGRHFELRSAVADNRCLDVQGASRALGAPLTIWECLTATQQTFDWEPTSGLLRVYVDGSTPLCVDGGADPRQEGPVYTYTCHGGPQQQWAPSTDGRGLQLRAYPERNLCLDVPGGTSQPGTRLWLYQCSGSMPQQWTGAPVLYAIPMDALQPTPRDSAAIGGYGEARFSLELDMGRVCAAAAIRYDRSRYGAITEAHIHVSPRGEGSPLEIGDWNAGEPLANGFNSPDVSTGVGAGRQCLTITPATVRRIMDDPANFYFNAHTVNNPVRAGGILRGQLSTWP